jgi:hypothetical protein
MQQQQRQQKSPHGAKAKTDKKQQYVHNFS